MKACGLLAALALCAATAAAQEAPRPDEAPLPPGAWAQVGPSGEATTILREAVEADARRSGLTPGQALRRLVASEVMRRNLVTAGHDPAALDAKALDAGVAETRAALQKAGAPPEQLARLEAQREALRVPVAMKDLVEALAAKEDLAKDFPRRRLELLGELRVRAIFIANGAGAAAKVADLQRQLGDAPTDAAFAELARKASDDPLAILTGGDLDWFSPRDGRVAPSIVEACLDKAAPGLVARPVTLRNAQALVFITEVRVPDATLEQLRPRLLDQARARIGAELMRRWFEETPVRLAPDAPR